jgi:hypothetical protein
MQFLCPTNQGNTAEGDAKKGVATEGSAILLRKGQDVREQLLLRLKGSPALNFGQKFQSITATLSTSLES